MKYTDADMARTEKFIDDCDDSYSPSYEETAQLVADVRNETVAATIERCAAELEDCGLRGAPALRRLLRGGGK